ncbi:MAG: hypothetical protein OXR73_04625 [Myxococcales bacterium]|nr:hypothetical protein [Myxococcales bacterium]
MRTEGPVFDLLAVTLTAQPVRLVKANPIVTEQPEAIHRAHVMTQTTPGSAIEVLDHHIGMWRPAPPNTLRRNDLVVALAAREVTELALALGNDHPGPFLGGRGGGQIGHCGIAASSDQGTQCSESCSVSG